MKVNALYLLGFVGLVLSLASGCDRAAPVEAADGVATEKSAAPVDRVVAGPPVRKTLQLFTKQPGRIEAFEVTPIYAKLAGYVEEVKVDIGDLVQKGQTLVRIWVPEMHDEVAEKEARVGQAEADVQQAQAAVTAAEAAAATAEAYISQMRAGIVRATAEHQRWTAEHRRLQDLASRGSVTERLVDETRNQLQAAEASRQEAEAAVVSAEAVLRQRRAEVLKSQSDVRAFQSRLRVAQAELARTKTLLAYAEIKAPFDGVITRRNVDTGHFVELGNGQREPLLVIARTDLVRIFVDVPETEAASVSSGNEGDAVKLQIQALGGQELEGRITRTSWSLDESNRSLRTEIDLPNPEGALRPGMYALATILLEERQNVITVPATAVVRNGREAHVCRVRAGKIEHVPVQPGLRSGADIEVLSGLDPQDTVVLLRAETLSAGQSVEVLPPT
ncbi:MAG: efflux RND transporter periplasmic adaptor subunit [Planctomycetes bacterium]|nr:efflux RND transporter periplasmic adaptor subunit [Planctomycetota bacterium]